MKTCICCKTEFDNDNCPNCNLKNFVFTYDGTAATAELIEEHKLKIKMEHLNRLLPNSSVYIKCFSYEIDNNGCLLTDTSYRKMCSCKEYDPGAERTMDIFFDKYEKSKDVKINVRIGTPENGRDIEVKLDLSKLGGTSDIQLGISFLTGMQAKLTASVGGSSISSESFGLLK